MSLIDSISPSRRITPTQVPEPTASLLSLVGLGWMGMLVSRTAFAVRRRPLGDAVDFS